MYIMHTHTWVDPHVILKNCFCVFVRICTTQFNLLKMTTLTVYLYKYNPPPPL